MKTIETHRFKAKSSGTIASSLGYLVSALLVNGRALSSIGLHFSADPPIGLTQTLLPYLGIAESLAAARSVRQGLLAEQERNVYFKNPSSIHIEADDSGHFTRISATFRDLLGFSEEGL